MAVIVPSARHPVHSVFIPRASMRAPAMSGAITIAAEWASICAP